MVSASILIRESNPTVGKFRGSQLGATAKRPCRVMSSNAGHCLVTGLLNREQAEALAERLRREAMFTGSGVRTLGSGERRYNPMSYHNGAVWTHDNALVAAGLARFKRHQDAIRILDGLIAGGWAFQNGKPR